MGAARHGVVVAYGNPLRGDDGVAWLIADEIRRVLPDVRVAVEHGLVPELAELVAAADAAVFVDAAASGAPGTVDVRPVAASAAPDVFGHAMAPAALLDLGRRVYGRVPPAFVVTIAGERFGVGTDVSPAVRAAVAPVVERIRAILRG